jgi:hypothetical protein
MNKRTIVVILLIGLFSFSSLFFISSCLGETESHQLDVTMYISIKDVDLANHRVLADVTLSIDGFLGTDADYLYVTFQDIDSYEVNCSHAGGIINGTHSFQGSVEGKYWYLNSYGEIYPYETNYVSFILDRNSLQYQINETRYGGIDWLYTFNFVNKQAYIQFLGLKKVDLDSTWTIANATDSPRFIVFLSRSETMPSFIIIAPLIVVLIAMILIPSFTNDRNAKITFYSAILVFSPMFIFAIQSFIPSRSSPSIPEFLGLMLMILSVSLFLVTLPKFEKERTVYVFEIAVLFVMVFFSINITPIAFSRLLSVVTPIQNIYTIRNLQNFLLTLLVVGIGVRVIAFLMKETERAKKKKEAEESDMKRFEEYNPEDFAH